MQMVRWIDYHIGSENDDDGFELTTPIMDAVQTIAKNNNIEIAGEIYVDIHIYGDSYDIGRISAKG